MKNKQMINQNFQHPLFGISIGTWIKLLNENGGVDKKYMYKAVFITLSSIFLIPMRVIFKLKYQNKINNLKIRMPPIIIIGHWRSGTTYLHELLCQDLQFCYVSLWNTLLPDSYLILKPFKMFLSKFLPKQRPMDSIEVEIDGPYEEEAGIAVLSQWSFFHCLHFPKNAEEQYKKSIHFQGLSEEEKTQWKKNYQYFMKSVVFSNQGKRLLLKDPANTGRISFLLDIFPDAKFIHIYRNPYKVYFSTIKMRNKVLDKLALQNSNREEIEKQVIENYKRLMKSFFDNKDKIPRKNFVEISYENLVKDPLKEIEIIYSKLDLPDFKNALPQMKRYLERKKDYKTNVYNIKKGILNHVYDNWKFTIDLWDYKPPK